jgi:hypothetical protein
MTISPNQKEEKTLGKRGFTRKAPLAKEFSDGRVTLTKVAGANGRHFMARTLDGEKVVAVASTVEGLLARLGTKRAKRA